MGNPVPSDADLPPLYVALRHATDALAEAERRRSLRVSLDETLADEVRCLVQLEAQLRNEKIGIMPLAKLDWRAELARILEPQDRRDDLDPKSDALRIEIAIHREAIEEVHAEASNLTETAETVVFARGVFDAALAAWEASLRDEDTEPARRLQRIDTDKASMAASLAEIGEATETAKSVVEALDVTIDTLLLASTNTRGPGELLGLTFKKAAPYMLLDAAESHGVAQQRLLLLKATLDDFNESFSPRLKAPEPVRFEIVKLLYYTYPERPLDWASILSRVEVGRSDLIALRSRVVALVHDLDRHRVAAGKQIEALDLQRWHLLIDQPPAISDTREAR